MKFQINEVKCIESKPQKRSMKLTLVINCLKFIQSIFKLKEEKWAQSTFKSKKLNLKKISTRCIIIVLG